MTVDELLATAETGVAATDEMLVIDPDTRQINLPGVELIFGVESDAQAERKYFYCPRYVGNGLDLASCFIRVNYRNANGAVDAYLVDDMAVTDDAITFSWALHRKVTLYKGQVQFVVCCNRPGGNGVPAAEWNTTVTTGIVLAGLEPDSDAVEAATADAITALLTKVDAQSANVEAVGAQEVAEVTAEGAAQVQAVKTASETAEAAAVAEIEAKGVNTLAMIPDDYTALSGAVTAIERGMAPGIVCEVEGTAVVVSDASNQAMRGLRIFGKSTQDGTPTPDAPVEIVSVESPVVTVCGRNLLKLTGENITWNGITYTVNDDGTVTVNGTATNLSYKNFTGNLPAGAYHFDGCPAGGDSDKGYFVRVISTDLVSKFDTIEGDDVGEGVDFALEAPATITIRVVVRAGATADNLVFKPMLRFSPSADKSFEPFVGGTVPTTHTLPGIPVTSGGNYTDSDGQQWICDEVDLERGVYVQRIKSVTYTGESGEYVSKYGLVGNGAAVSRKSDDYLRPNSADSVVPAFCDKLTITTTSDVYSNGSDGKFAFSTSGSTIRFSLDALSGYTVEEIRSWLNENPLTFTYILATTIETPLSETEIAAYRALHTNKPNTTILNDSGAHMAVAYTADTKLYIDNLLKE